MNKRLLLLAVLILLLLTGQVRQPAPAHACSCVYTDDWKLRLEQYGAIFVGEVTDVGFAYGEFLGSKAITFKVYAAWKGVSTSQVTIYADELRNGNCGVGIGIGQRWLISTSGDGGYVTSCSMPVRLQRAADDLAALGNPTYGSMDALYKPNSKTLLPETEPGNSDPLGSLLPYILSFVVLASIVIVLPAARRRM